VGKSTPKAPAAPDPVATANAQAAANQQTAEWNAVLNNTNQVTPYGNLTYTRNPSAGVGADGKPLPASYTATTTLSPQQQQMLDYNNQVGIGEGKLATDQLGRISTALSSPVSYADLPNAPTTTDFSADRQKVTDALMSQYQSRLDPQWQNEKAAFDAQMFAKGIGQGSEAYTNAYNDFSRSKNDAYTSALNNAVNAGGAEQSRLFGLGQTQRQQAIQEYMQQREAPINETSALLSGTQVQNPSFTNTPQNGAAQAGDIQGNTYNTYQGQLAQYQNQLKNQQSTLGSIFGLAGSVGGAYAGSDAGSAAISALFKSDVRLKDDVVLVGKENGHNIYEFTYLADPTRRRFRGVMAQEVIKTRPDAVTVRNGAYAVNYDKLGIEFKEVA